MSSFILKYITNRLLKDNQWNRLGVEDPYHEYVEATTTLGKVYEKKIPRRIPDGLSINDTKILQTFKNKAYRYDMWFSVLGVKFGWTNIVGIIPVVGTIVSTYWSLKLLWMTRSLDDGFPLDLQLLFILNIGIDFLLGLIPFVGDIIEIGYKSNSRNYLLLEKHLVRVGMKNQGLITEDEVRSNYINNNIQPVLNEKVIPSMQHAGEKIYPVAQKAGQDLKFIVKNIRTKDDTASNGTLSAVSTTSTLQPSSAAPTTTHTSATTVTSKATAIDTE